MEKLLNEKRDPQRQGEVRQPRLKIDDLPLNARKLTPREISAVYGGVAVDCQRNVKV
jgi:hypothetical protein